MLNVRPMWAPVTGGEAAVAGMFLRQYGKGRLIGLKTVWLRSSHSGKEFRALEGSDVLTVRVLADRSGYAFTTKDLATPPGSKAELPAPTDSRHPLTGLIGIVTPEPSHYVTVDPFYRIYGRPTLPQEVSITHLRLPSDDRVQVPVEFQLEHVLGYDGFSVGVSTATTPLDPGWWSRLESLCAMTFGSLVSQDDLEWIGTWLRDSLTQLERWLKYA